ncbi:MAG TPA: HAMP domain-containing sensor histidine kinase [Thermoanaerobaculia bacterium]|nr:HAMP domain-containing sensor histidine kinase [Thermoanaerobaculia bacterium]
MEPWLESFARANFRRSADTAHDLKTPLNVAVLNLELLRMRLRKLAGEDDEKIAAYAVAIETELRRMGRIFDAFFLLSTPPKNDAPEAVDVAAICGEEAASAGYEIDRGGPAVVCAHESRIRQALRLFFQGASKLFREHNRRVEVSRDATSYAVSVAGTPEAADFELTKIFKFYYTDPHGNPDLSLAVARLIAETYGGELDATEEEHDKVSVRLSFPLGDR